LLARRVQAAVAEATEAHQRWRRTGEPERRARFNALLDTLLDRADEIAATVTAETGKPLIESYSAELFVSAETARWIGGASERLLRPQRLVPPRLVAFKRTQVVREPLGVVAVVSP
jgi:aldehyde dehydrogenase (NAD+)